MSVEIDVAGEVEERVVQVTQTTKVRIAEINFNFIDQTMLLGLSFGVMEDGQFIQKKQQGWILQGPPLNQIVQMAPSSDTRLAVIRDTVRDIVQRIQGDPQLRQQLIDNGHLIRS